MKKSHFLRHLHVSLLQPEDVIPHLGKGKEHWQPGRSAQLTARSWFEARDFPASIAAILATGKDFGNAELVDAFLERTVDLGDGREPSHTDVMAVVGVGNRLGVLAVEAKVDEPFGPFVQEWLDAGKANSDAGAGRSARLDHLCALLELPRTAALPLRYQLLHRTASALIEARRYRATLAEMMVQSFCTRLPQTGLADFQSFAEAMGFAQLEPGVLSAPKMIGGISFSLGWASDATAFNDGSETSG